MTWFRNEFANISSLFSAHSYIPWDIPRHMPYCSSIWYDFACSATETEIKNRYEFEFTKDTPNLTLLGELWGVFFSIYSYLSMISANTREQPCSKIFNISFLNIIFFLLFKCPHWSISWTSLSCILIYSSPVRTASGFTLPPCCLWLSVTRWPHQATGSRRGQRYRQYQSYNSAACDHTMTCDTWKRVQSIPKNKLESIQKRALRFVCDDFVSNYSDLFEKNVVPKGWNSRLCVIWQ